MSLLTEFSYDVAVIGGGSAGYAAARTCAAAGLRTVVIEGGEKVGGLCILRGCMPTKAFLYSAEVAHLVSESEKFGIHSGTMRPDLRAIVARKDKLINEFADYRAGQLEKGRFEFIRAQASFKDAHTLTLDNGDEISARHFILCTGSVVAPSPLPELEEVGYLTSDDALELKELPKSLIVLGGGAIAVEFAQFYARLGVAVTLIQRSEQILREEDGDVAAVIETVFRKEGMAVFTGTCLMRAEKRGGQKVVRFTHEGKEKEVAADEIFFALGRIPRLANIGLENTGVTIAYGRFLVNSKMQTDVEHIFAAGDCTGLHEIVHIAIQQGEIAGHNIAHPEDQKESDYRLLTSVVFTDPQIGRVGLTERDAIAQKIPFLTASYPFADHGKSLLMNAVDGFVKLLAHSETGEILGGCCVGPHGGELIHEIIAAMYKRMTVRELALMPHYHPTLAEIWTYPAEELAEKTP